MTADRSERISSVVDIYDSNVQEFECLIDPVARDVVASLEMAAWWSKKLGISLLTDEDKINHSFKYPIKQ